MSGYLYHPPESFLEMYDLLVYVAYEGRPRRPEARGARQGGKPAAPKGLVRNQQAADYLERVDQRLYDLKYRILGFLTPDDPNLVDLEKLLQAYEQRKCENI